MKTPTTELVKQLLEARQKVTQGERYKDRDYPESKVSNGRIIGRFYSHEDAVFDCLTVNSIEQLCTDFLEMKQALENIKRTDAPYSTQDPGVSRLKHCVAVATETLAKLEGKIG